MPAMLDLMVKWVEVSAAEPLAYHLYRTQRVDPICPQFPCREEGVSEKLYLMLFWVL